MSNSSIWPIDRTQWGATTTDQRESGSNGNEGVLLIPQISKAPNLQISKAHNQIV